MNRNNNSGYSSKHIMIHLDGNEGGGIRTVAEAWHEGFTEKGLRISYLMNRYGDYTKHLCNNGREVYCADMGEIRSKSWYLSGIRMPDVVGWSRSLNSTRIAQPRFEQILQELRPDVVLGNGAGSTAVIGPACKKSGVDLISCFHGISHPSDFFSLRKRIIAFLLNHYCREIVGVSHETIKTITPYLHIPHRVIFNSVSEVVIDQKTRFQLRNHWKIEDHSIVFGNASRISPSKALHRFVDAAKEIIRTNADMHTVFLIAGEPRSQSDQAYLDNIISTINRDNLQDRIRYVGYQKIADFYSAIDVFCHTHSLVEPLGLTVVEAISAGLPIIVCNKGGFLEFLPEDVGIRYDGTSYRKLAEAMQQMLDISLQKEQSEKGRKFYLDEYISYAQWIEKWLECLFCQNSLHCKDLVK